jgi:hypothetical protein
MAADEATMRYTLLALALLGSGCSKPSHPFDDPRAVANLKAQAAEVERAMIEEDHQRMADLTHPLLVNQLGGRGGFIRKLEAVADDLRKQGLKFHSFRFATPSKMIESSGELYAIYPYSLESTGPNGEQVSQPSYLVCTSGDKGMHWKFLDGSGVGGDREKLKRILPQFPDQLSLPEPQPLAPRQ